MDMRINKTLLIGTLIMAFIGLAIIAFDHWGMFPSLTVQGVILDEKGQPVQDAKVIAQFGIADEGPAVMTEQNGRFTVRVSSLRWSNGKGPPSFTVIKSGYRTYWGYFKQWSWGPRKFIVTVQLRPGPQDHPYKDNL